MNFIKKHIGIIIPAVLVVVSFGLIGASFASKSSLKEQMNNQSVAAGEQIDRLLRTAVAERQYEIEKQFQDKYEADANAIKQLWVQSSQRELLNYKLFPEPKESTIQIFNEFGRTYESALENLITDMKALDAPSELEIRKASGPAVNGGGRGDGIRGRGIGTSISGIDERIVDLVCKQRAEEIIVYGNPENLSGYGFWKDYNFASKEQAIQDCWYSQISYWIQKDIADTISAVNSQSSSVSNSAVKRLLKISFGNDRAETDMPIYVQDKGTLAEAWTERKTGDDIDVVHFEVSVIVRTEDVQKFVNELCSEKQHLFKGYNGKADEQILRHNQISVLKMAAKPILPESDEHKLYRYGDDANVELNLICEYVFYRAGYDKIKPKPIKEALGQFEKPEEPSRTSGRSRRSRRSR